MENTNQSSIIDRSLGYLRLKLRPSPKTGLDPTDEHERNSVSNAHDESEVVAFDDKGEVIMVVKLTAIRASSATIGIKAVQEILLCRPSLLDSQQREKLERFHHRCNGSH